ncbi:beta-propeller fold lactonase family protein [Paraburkholderia sp.]|uniref:lactonase family protein n=1 Tax=Paraburkholderia sp. TaxID=1926495 RepID=UPI00238E8463|nr:beta-propeller fold lactonase family protein [Paraburkholderia sp.]MDE1182593.1 beta-propeller fold lactonase family protein [Paraburkholderia sp.]
MNDSLQTQPSELDNWSVSRRTLLKRAVLLAGLASIGRGILPVMAASREIDLYSGSWIRKGGKKGFYRYKFDTGSGKLTFAEKIDDAYSVGGTLVNAARKLVYITDESDEQPDFRVGGGGTVGVYRINPASGALTKLGAQKSYGANPSMISIDPTGRYMVASIHASDDAVTRVVKTAAHQYEIVAQYPTTSINLFPLNADGTLAPPLDVHQMSGSGPRKNQRTSHPHCVVWEPEGKFFICCDKGADRIYSMSIDYGVERIVQTAAPYMLEPGSLPRYARFNADKKLVYVNFENANEVAVFSYNERGALTRLGAEPVVTQALMAKIPAGAHLEQQDMRLHPSGKFLFTVVRGSLDYMEGDERKYKKGFDGVTSFAIGNNGMLKRIDTIELAANWPRGCAISPDGRYIVVPCLYSDEILTLAIAEDGTLSKVSSIAQNAAANLDFFAA